MAQNIKSITVVGAGAWGTALAIHLAKNGHEVTLWGKGVDEMQQLAKSRQNHRYLPGISFPDTLHIGGDWEALTNVHDDVLLAVPSHVFQLVLSGIQRYFTPKTRLIWATKGLDAQHHRLLEGLVLDVCGASQRYAVLSGPSFATEVARDLPTAVVIASHDLNVAQHFATLFNSTYFRVYTNTDLVGVQLGGALKNVIAIAVGLSDGLGFGANAKSALITRGLAELTRLGVALGAKQETFMGLSGIGDLVLTCTDNQSRNRRMGLALAEGLTIAEAQQSIGQVIEGAHTAELMLELAKKHAIELPITTVIYQVLKQQLSPREAVLHLLSRASKSEL